MNALKVNPGDSITAALHNRVVDRLPEENFGKGPPPLAFNRLVMYASNGTATDYAKGDVVPYTTGAGPTTIDDIEGNYELAVSAAGTLFADFGIAVDPIPAAGHGRICLLGMVAATVNVTATTDRFASLDAATPKQLKSSDTGAIDLLPPSATGVVACMVNIAPARSVLWRCKLNEAFTAGEASAKLMRLDGTQFAPTIDVLDSLTLMDDQVLDSVGFCQQVGTKFYAIQAPC